MPNLIAMLLKRKTKLVADSRIRYGKQQSDYDCGQTCLDMLGYDGHRMFPGKAVIEDKVAEIFGYARDQIRCIDFNEKTFFELPYFLTVMRGDQWGWHAVIGFKDQIYCPSLGIFKIPDYKKYIWNSTTGFPIPFAEDNNKNNTY